MSKDAEARKFYESERKNIVVTHDDFCFEQNFDYIEESENLKDFLLSKTEWEKSFEYNKEGIMKCHVKILNDIFTEVFKLYDKKLDSVEIFDIITTFYTLDYVKTYNSLVHNHRERLKKDLIVRIGDISLNSKVKVDDQKIQLSFASLFKNMK